MLSQTLCLSFAGGVILCIMFFLPNLSPPKNNTFANSEKKTFAESHVGTLAAFVMENLYMDLEIDNHMYNIYIYNLLQSIMGLGNLIWGHQFGSFEPHIIPIRNYSYV